MQADAAWVRGLGGAFSRDRWFILAGLLTALTFWVVFILTGAPFHTDTSRRAPGVIPDGVGARFPVEASSFRCAGPWAGEDVLARGVPRTEVVIVALTSDYILVDGQVCEGGQKWRAWLLASFVAGVVAVWGFLSRRRPGSGSRFGRYLALWLFVTTPIPVAALFWGVALI